jgi:hypothetical protein
VITEFGRHLRNWLEVYLWVPVTLVGIYGSAQLAYFLSGRRPVESPDFLVGYSGKAVEIVYIIALTSIAKQAWGTWMSTEQKIDNPYVYTINTIATFLTAGLVTYVFLH